MKLLLISSKKTRGLDYEWVLYFDYVSGEILRCASGESNNVEMHFEDGEFEGNHVASIHNHPKEALSPPSGKNFGIFTRDFEDYELVAGFGYFWILKSKGLHKSLYYQANSFSDVTFELSHRYCSNRYRDIKIISKMHDIKYGDELLKYINNKNINDIQLIKKEYVIMDNSKTATFKCRKRITDPEAIRIARELENDPNTPSAKELMYAFYQAIGMDVDYDSIFAD